MRLPDISTYLLVIFAATSGMGGQLISPAPPGNTNSAMCSLQSLYARLTTGTNITRGTGGFVEPTQGPTNATGYTLNEIMAVAPATVADADGARASDVAAGLKFWQLTESGWGVATGTAQYHDPGPRGQYVTGITASAVPTSGGTIGVLTFAQVMSPTQAVRVVAQNQLGTNLTVVGVTPTNVSFLIPAGTGQNAYKLMIGPDLRVMPYGQYGPVYQDYVPLNYDSPVIASVRGGLWDEGPATFGCNINGGDMITISGSNFGTNINQVAITINGVSVSSNKFMTLLHSQIRCEVPASSAGGFNVPVTVTVNGRSGTSNLLSYIGPTIDPFGSVNLTTCRGGETNILYGQWFGADTNNVTVRYGAPGTPFDEMPFKGNILSVNNTQIVFTTSAGVGAGLACKVKLMSMLTLESSGTFSYPVPLIVPTTLRANPGDTGMDFLTGVTTEGDRIYFGAMNVGTQAALVAVSAGAMGGPYVPCYDVQLLASNTISCRLPPGAGGPNVFVVTAYNADSAPGLDVYYYPLAPTISKVSGGSDSGSATVGCPTEGGIRLTLSCQFIVEDDLSVFVGGQGCADVRYVNATNITCILPAGCGVNVPVFIKNHSLISRSFAGLSYAPPGLLRTYKESNPANTNAVFAAAGGELITLEGSNFGADGGLLFIGGKQVTGLVHDPVMPHAKLTCVTPAIPHGGADQTVVFVNKAGIAATNSLTLDYWMAQFP